MNRVGIVWAAACAGVVMVAGASGIRAQQGARVVQVAELPDVPLGTFHNSFYGSASERITDDRGVRMGSLGSDIFWDPTESFNEFWTVTDRGPNGNPGRRTFVVPGFNPVILHVRVQGDRVNILNAVPIRDAAGAPVSGLSNIAGFDEAPFNFDGSSAIGLNPNGLDTEGLVRTRDGHFWLVDEYSPSLVHLGPDGRVIDRFVPVDSPLGTTPTTTPNYRVKKFLPSILNFRRQNRGFEGLAVTPDDRTLFIAMQSPLDYPTPALGRASRSVRILRFDIGAERVTGEFVYFFDEVCAFLAQPVGCGVVPGEMKISGLIGLSSTTLLVEERTDTVAKVYRIDLSGATNILGSSWDSVAASPGATTPALESLAAPSSQGIIVTPKTLVVDLSTLPGVPNKIEGIALVRPNILVIANDNDFGMVDNATFNASGRLSNDTLVKSRLMYIQLAGPVN